MLVLLPISHLIPQRIWGIQYTTNNFFLIESTEQKENVDNTQMN